MTPDNAPADDTPIDLMVIGAGVNGAGIARDAAGRGLSVMLCEQADVGEGTSSRSGKLVHGGLRYLEYYEFRLVREALKEREVLLRNAPHIIWPMRFVLPHDKSLRPAWMVRAGLFLYDHLGGRQSLPRSRGLNLRRDPEGEPLQEKFRKGFEYSDCWVDDARLVLLNVKGAVEQGAMFMPRTRCVQARREDGVWRIRLHELASGETHWVYARALVNAAGPWVDQWLREAAGYKGSKTVRLVKGSHIVIPKFYAGSQAYLLQNTDKRVIFVNPYQGDYLLIGTTDIAYDGQPDDVTIDDSEIEYLCSVINRYFKAATGAADVVSSFSGVRPLYDDSNANPSAVTRDYVFDVTDQQGKAPLLSVYGGKITTYRRLSEHAIERMMPYFPHMAAAWTAGTALPGGDMADADFERFLSGQCQRYDWMDAELVRHYARCYGSRMDRLLQDCRALDDLGRRFGNGLYEREARYCVAEEWVRTPEDFLWRRTKFGLHLSDTQIAAFRHWMMSTVESVSSGIGQPQSAD